LMFMAGSLLCAQTPGTQENLTAETTLINFDELLVKEMAAAAFKRPFLAKRFAFDTYREKHGLQLGTAQLIGQPLVGGTVQLTNPVAAFGVFSGDSQPFISPSSILIASGGGTFDLVLTFETPVTSVSIVSDRSKETPDLIRMMVVKPVDVPPVRPRAVNQIRRRLEVQVLAMVEKSDDAMNAPNNTLLLDLKGKPFHHVVIECTTEQEGFDDLQFTRSKARVDAKPERVLPIFNWEVLSRSNGIDDATISAGWGNSTISTRRSRVATFPKETHSLELKDSGFTDAEMVHLSRMKNLRRLGLGGTVISDQGLKVLRGLTELERLDLRASRVSETGDAPNFPNLKTFQKAGQRPWITDTGLRELTGLKQLRWLDLTDTQITDAGLAVLKELTNLEELSLANTSISTLGIKELLGFKNLRHLDLWQTQVDDVGLLELIKIKSLKHVVVGESVSLAVIDRAHGLRTDIAFSRIGPEYWDLDEVCLSGRIRGASGSRLRVMDDPSEKGSVLAEVILTARNTSDATTRFIPFVRNLKSLDVSSTNISDVGLIEIGKQKNLRELRLSGTHITDDGLVNLRALSQLRHLWLSGIRSEDLLSKDQGGGLSRPSVARLRALQNSGERPHITDAGLKHLEGLKNLETLDLFASQVTDAGLRQLQGLQNLKSLSLGHSPITDAGIKDLADFNRLESLNLAGTNVTDEGLLELKNLSSLRSLQGDAPITQHGVAHAQKLMPSLKITFPRRLNSGR
jgi:Leucine-rich repeat (LRR) protein